MRTCHSQGITKLRSPQTRTRSNQGLLSPRSRNVLKLPVPHLLPLVVVRLDLWSRLRLRLPVDPITIDISEGEPERDVQRLQALRKLSEARMRTKKAGRTKMLHGRFSTSQFPFEHWNSEHGQPSTPVDGVHTRRSRSVGDRSRDGDGGQTICVPFLTTLELRRHCFSNPGCFLITPGWISPLFSQFYRLFCFPFPGPTKASPTADPLLSYSRCCHWTSESWEVPYTALSRRIPRGFQVFYLNRACLVSVCQFCDSTT